MSQVKVLVVDDSVTIQKLLSEIINSHPKLTVVGVALDPIEARDKIKQLNPDVITLDVEMPKMDGITFLRNLMRLRPMPVVMISTLTEAGASTTLEALELGAVDYISKPQLGSGENLSHYSQTIFDKVLAASQAQVRILEKHQPIIKQPSLKDKGFKLKSKFICAIGASTGGTEAIKEVLMGLPIDCPPIVLAQHIPAGFSTSFSERMNKTCDITVYEAYDGQLIMPGCAYIAPGDKHLLIKKAGLGYQCVLCDGDLVNRHKPSVEVLFDSVTDQAGDHAIGLMLTGMGADGAEAMLRMRQAGCETVAQDEATSVVWGMPGAAVKLGGACRELPLHKMSKFIMHKACEK